MWAVSVVCRFPEKEECKGAKNLLHIFVFDFKTHIRGNIALVESKKSFLLSANTVFILFNLHSSFSGKMQTTDAAPMDFTLKDWSSVSYTANVTDFRSA